ncbi:hypothetical protein DID88_002212 [Monilinia fructigena]|uniref:Uncharacterized protein n=1 Tax=Monilinia fructigena TaxID=38457 RepID=A0A395IVY9_9HELO|nr:hypothetical protein DID88_002212 [Monilinia fructigena]
MPATMESGTESGMDLRDFSSVEHGTTPTALYSWRPPSPLIFIYHLFSVPVLRLFSSEYRGLGDEQETREILSIITQGQNVSVERDTMTAQARILSGAKVARQLGMKNGAVDVSGNNLSLPSLEPYKL